MFVVCFAERIVGPFFTRKVAERWLSHQPDSENGAVMYLVNPVPPMWESAREDFDDG